MLKRKSWFPLLLILVRCGVTPLLGSEADIKIPDLEPVTFSGLGGVSGLTLMYLGILICAAGAIFGLVQYKQTKALPVHESMGNVSNTIWETCKTYLFQQGKFLAILWVLIAACMVYYFIGLPWNDPNNHLSHGELIRNGFVILLASILGILGSYGVAWFGIRINTVSNSRTAFSALKGNPLPTRATPLPPGITSGRLPGPFDFFFMFLTLWFFLRARLGPSY